MKKWVNILIWAILLFLITPSTMALASWNAVPGDTTYPWKLSLERVLLMFMSPSSKLKSTTQVKITERRFNELEQTLGSEYAFESLDNLEKQLTETTSDIQQINKQETQEQVKEQYIASLKKMSSSLEQQKTQVITGNVSAVAQKSTSSKQSSNNNSAKPTSTANQNVNASNQNTNANNNNNVIINTGANTNTTNKVVNPTVAPSITVSPTPSPTPSSEDLVKEIEETQEKIEEEIVKVETTTTDTQKNNSRNEDDKEEEEKRPKWVKPEPTVQVPTRTNTGNVSLPNLGNNNKDNDKVAPANQKEINPKSQYIMR